MQYVHFGVFVLQIFLSAWFFRGVAPRAPISHRQHLLSHLWLLLLFPLFTGIEQYTPLGISLWGSYFRFIYRGAVYILFLLQSKKLSLPNAIYLSFLASTLFTICQGVIQLSIVFGNGNPLSNLLYIPIMLACSYLLPLKHPYHITRERCIVLFLISCCALYTKTSFFDFGVSVYSTVKALPTYLLLLHIFLLLFLCFFERYVSKSQQAENFRVQEVTTEYLLHSLEARENSEKELRSLHHDMKNHLMTIQEMSRQLNCPPIQQYTQQLLQRTTSYERHIKTGNHLLDALIEDKFTLARQEGIVVQANLDFHQIDYVEPIDLCTIFANALDNAIEACKKVPSSQVKYIDISSTVSAQQLFVTIQNSYIGHLTFYQGRPITTKPFSHRHGFGLVNLQKAMEHYCGVAHMSTPEPNRFLLTLIFPIH